MSTNILKTTLFLIGLLFLGYSLGYAQSPVDYVQLGNGYYEQGRYGRAIDEYTKALDIDPNYAKAYDNRGVALAQEGNLTGAISDFTMAIANNPNDAEAYNNRGHVYARQGLYVQAISDYSNAIKIKPNYAKAYNNRGEAYYNTKKYDRARADVQKTQELRGDVDPYLVDELKKVSSSSSIWIFPVSGFALLIDFLV